MSLVQIGQAAPQRSLLEMIQQLAEQEHQMLIEARRKALGRERRSNSRRRAGSGAKLQDKARTRVCA